MTEKLSSSGFEREDNIAKLEQFIQQATEGYRAEKIPVGTNGRIDMSAYKQLYPDVENDIAKNRDWDEEWFGNVPSSQMESKRRQMEGEHLEMLAYGVFLKNLSEDFVVARASSYDDRKNKVDTVILDKKTGALICAFDEVGDTSGADYEKKQELVRDHNLHDGGASLKYGLGVSNEKGKKTVTPSSSMNVPLFYIALPPDRIQKGMKEFLPGQKDQSEFEKKLFIYFVATITAQIEGLELYSGRLNENLKKN